MDLVVGDVFRMTLFPEDGVKPKHAGDMSRTKYFVVIGLDEGRVMAASLLVNSKINDRLFSIIGPYQHCIHSEDYSFLTKSESYVDCFRIKEISAERIIENADYVGRLNADDIDEILNLTVSSPNNRKGILKKYHLI